MLMSTPGMVGCEHRCFDLKVTIFRLPAARLSPKSRKHPFSVFPIVAFVGIKDSERRDLPLEALRGLAALAVVAWHFLLAFAPALLADPAYGLAGTPFYAFVHGTGAVCIFFVLSGYVLTRRYFETGQKRVLINGALKRWFRLFLPVFLSVMLSWLFFHFHLYAYESAGLESRSDWLATFGFAMKPPFDPTFGAAVANGLSEAFFHDNNAFNPLLWTIHIEFMGSYLVFGFAALITMLRGRAEFILLAVLLIGFAAHFVEPFLFPFLPGCMLAYCAPRLKGLKGPAAAGCILLGLVFLGYRDPVGLYGFLDFLVPINGEALRAYTSTVGAVLMMISFIGNERLRRFFSGAGARLLGRLSFPIYLVHLILIFSLGSAVFLFMKSGNSAFVTLTITALALVPAIAVLATIFAVIDTQWVAFVNRISRKIIIAV